MDYDACASFLAAHLRSDLQKPEVTFTHLSVVIPPNILHFLDSDYLWFRIEWSFVKSYLPTDDKICVNTRVP